MKKLILILLVFCLTIGCSEDFGENVEYNYEITIWYLQKENPRTIHYTVFSSINYEPIFYMGNSDRMDCLSVQSDMQQLRIDCSVRKFEIKLISKKVI